MRRSRENETENEQETENYCTSINISMYYINGIL